MMLKRSRRTSVFSNFTQESLHSEPAASENRKNEKKEFVFQKQSGRVIENKGKWQKQTENKAETKLQKLLKTQEAPEKQTENKPKNKAGHVIENKGWLKTEPEDPALLRHEFGIQSRA